ncbi:MAG: endonuclease/exonuclease/phosphatase family protein [Devosia sp.]
MFRHIGLPIVFAALALPASALELKVMSFNIWYGGEQVSFAKVVEAIKAADADIVGLQETDGNLARLAAEAGYPYYDIRRNILSRYPIFDPALGERQAAGPGPYAMPPLDVDAIHALVMVEPGKVVAVANTHLTSDPYGPQTVMEGGDLAAALETENSTRVPEAQMLVDGLRPVIETGIPVLLIGDFNSPPYLDWTETSIGLRQQIKFAVEWPVSKLLADAGFTDTYRAANPDVAAAPGITWSPGSPVPINRPDDLMDRIDWVLAANAVVTSSTMVGESGGQGVDVAVDPWPSDHRAVLTTLDVQPVDAPALIAVEPARVTTGADFRVRAFMPGWTTWTGYVVPRGGDAATDAITGIADVPLNDRPTVKLAGRTLAPGAYDAVLLDAEGAEQARTQFYVVDPAKPATLVTDKSSYAVGEPITVTWTGTLGERFEWFGIYEKDEPNVYNYWAYTYTAGHVDGSMVIGPDILGELPAGDYEIRLQRDDHYVVEAEAEFSITD